MASHLDWVQPYTKSSPQRLVAMARACQRIDNDGIVGDIVECGVWRGGNIILARFYSPDRICWLYDTFEGMFNRSEWDVSRSGVMVGVGKSAVSVEEVTENLRISGTLDARKLRFVKGAVEDTLLDANNLPDKIALLRLDTDWYYSTKIELEVLWPRLAVGGILIVDDYGHWMGARKAVDEYFGGALSFKHIDYTAIMTVKHA
jgi:hypothetical protein